jgi:hypothetical protein
MLREDEGEENRDVEEIIMSLSSTNMTDVAPTLEDNSGDFVSRIAVNTSTEAAAAAASADQDDQVENITVVTVQEEEDHPHSDDQVPNSPDLSADPEDQKKVADSHPEDNKVDPHEKVKMNSSPNEADAVPVSSPSNTVENIELDPALSSSPKKRQFDEFVEATEVKDDKKEVKETYQHSRLVQ